MDSLQDILGTKQFQAPDEIKAIKDYIWRKYKSGSRIRIEKDVIVVAVINSALAATLQLERPKLIEACGLKKRLVIRTGR